MARSLARKRRMFARAVMAAGLCVGCATGVFSQESSPKSAKKPTDPSVTVAAASALPSQAGSLTIVDPNVKQAQDPTVTPFQPPPVQPPPVQPAPTTGAATPFGNLGAPSAAALEAIGPDRRGAATQVSADVVSGGSQTQFLATTDAGNLIGKSISAPGVETQRRSPVANESRVRGYHIGQLTTQAEGVYWFPARQDLDTFLSKIDSGVIDNVIVLKGPYSARYGPGFAFIDIDTIDSPRYEGGFQMDGRSLFTYKTNGQQLYGRQGFWGGSDWWGFRVSYGHRTGNDYETGSGIEMPSSYNVRDIDFVYGVNVTPNSRLEFGYLRLDQTNLEFPGQVFDTEFLVTNGYRLRYVVVDQPYFDRLTIDGFYNRTSLAGNAQRQGKREQIQELTRLNFVGFTDVDEASTGYRAAVTWGRTGEVQLTVGNDFRYVTGALNEFDSLFFGSAGGLPLPCANVFNFPIPRSHQYVANGIFLENVTPVNDRLTVTAGGRVDWVGTDIDRVPPGFTCATFEQALQNNLGTTDVNPDYTLYLGYVTGDYKLSDTFTLTGGLGHAQRPPTLTELYALGPFLATLQQGFTTVLGNPQLGSERLYQIDVGVKADNGWARAGANAFYAFIEDYITYQVEDLGGFKLASAITNAFTVRFVNTDLATLAGFELYGEMDLTDYLTPYATVSFVEGRDLTRDGRGDVVFVIDRNTGRRTALPGIGALGADEEPLPNIAPMETRVGLRLHEGCRNPRWGVELSSRIVNTQDRFAQSLGEERTGGFVVYDIRGYWQARKGVLLTGGVENLLDRNYREHLDLRTGLGVSQPGVTGYMGVELKY